MTLAALMMAQPSHKILGNNSKDSHATNRKMSTDHSSTNAETSREALLGVRAQPLPPICDSQASKDSSRTMKSLLHLHDITVTYGTKSILREVTIEADAGEFVAIVGPSGCGKTTCLNVACGEVSPTSGQVLWQGTPTLPSPHELTYMFARDALLPWRRASTNVQLSLESLKIPRKERRERALQMLDEVGLLNEVDKYPSQLSQGMRQRVALARTFVRPAPLMLMDEPFAAVDAQTRLTLQSLLLRLWENQRSAVLFITHDLAEAITLADKVVVMGGMPGRIQATIDISLRRPRNVRELRGSEEFLRLQNQMWDMIEASGSTQE